MEDLKFLARKYFKKHFFCFMAVTIASLFAIPPVREAVANDQPLELFVAAVDVSTNPIAASQGHLSHLVGPNDAIPTGTSVIVSVRSARDASAELRIATPSGESRSVPLNLRANQPARLLDPSGRTFALTSSGRYEISVTRGNERFTQSIFAFEATPPDLSDREVKEGGALSSAQTRDLSPLLHLESHLENNLNLSHSLEALKREVDQVATRSGTGARVFRAASPAVVLVLADRGGLGSGVIINDRGQIITNQHVVGTSQRVGVVLKPQSGEQIKPNDVISATVVKVDEVADLALLQLSRVPPGLPALRLGDERSLEVGGMVHAIGHPDGEYWTYTQGVVSQIRENYNWRADDRGVRRANVIQTQTPINPGNSGGPLLDDSQTIVGINTFGATNRPGLNFAVAASSVRQFLNEPGSRRLPPQAANSGGAAQGRSQAAGNCQPRSFEPFRDAQGKIVRPLDTECRGWPNVYMVGQTADGKPEMILVDRVGDRKIDVRIIVNVNNQYDLWIFYANRDNVPTSYGYDYQRNGQIERTIVVSTRFR